MPWLAANSYMCMEAAAAKPGPGTAASRCCDRTGPGVFLLLPLSLFYFS